MTSESLRERRRAELQSTELVRLVAVYRRIFGLDDIQPLPASLTFTALIDSILDDEEQSGTLRETTRWITLLRKPRRPLQAIVAEARSFS
jgi:hypothetical protein